MSGFRKPGFPEYTCTWSYLDLLLQSQSSLQADRDHLIGDRKLVRELGALFNHDRVATVQKLVAKHEVLLPVLHHILWNNTARYNTVRNSRAQEVKLT